jgi:hypothetical protein
VRYQASALVTSIWSEDCFTSIGRRTYVIGGLVTKETMGVAGGRYRSLTRCVRRSSG